MRLGLLRGRTRLQLQRGSTPPGRRVARRYSLPLTPAFARRPDCGEREVIPPTSLTTVCRCLVSPAHMGGKDDLQVSSARGSRVNNAQSRDKGRLRRQLVALAVDQAMASQWPQAIETNLYLINASGRDVEAYNRLGKAYTQLGRVSEACEAYTATLQIDPTNAIARRNVTRLAALIDGAAALEDSGAQLRRAAP